MAVAMAHQLAQLQQQQMQMMQQQMMQQQAQAAGWVLADGRWVPRGWMLQQYQMRQAQVHEANQSEAAAAAAATAAAAAAAAVAAATTVATAAPPAADEGDKGNEGDEDAIDDPASYVNRALHGLDHAQALIQVQQGQPEQLQAAAGLLAMVQDEENKDDENEPLPLPAAAAAFQLTLLRPPSKTPASAAASLGKRKDWDVFEDKLIRSEVRRIGEKSWRQIAEKLTGRSADAVRNRHKRLKEADESLGLLPSSRSYTCSACGQPKKGHTCSAPAVDTGDSHPELDTKRHNWTTAEDDLITHLVQELGHRWCQIAEQLPGRTDHAIRNRWSRLVAVRFERGAAAEVVPEPFAAAVVGPAPVAAAGPPYAAMNAEGGPQVSETRRPLPPFPHPRTLLAIATHTRTVGPYPLPGAVAQHSIRLTWACMHMHIHTCTYTGHDGRARGQRRRRRRHDANRCADA